MATLNTRAARRCNGCGLQQDHVIGHNLTSLYTNSPGSSYGSLVSASLPTTPMNATVTDFEFNIPGLSWDDLLQIDSVSQASSSAGNVADLFWLQQQDLSFMGGGENLNFPACDTTGSDYWQLVDQLAASLEQDVSQNPVNSGVTLPSGSTPGDDLYLGQQGFEAALPLDEGPTTWSAEELQLLNIPSVPTNESPSLTESTTVSRALVGTHACSFPGCFKCFKKPSQLKYGDSPQSALLCSMKPRLTVLLPHRQHQRGHTRPEVCPHCRSRDGTPTRFADRKGLRRHIWAKHSDLAEGAAVPTVMRQCPAPECSYVGREDNVSRHCEKKHGRKLRWKREKAQFL
jgi:hypothetical protein